MRRNSASAVGALALCLAVPSTPLARAGDPGPARLNLTPAVVEGAKLTGCAESGSFGASVALSADARTALVACPTANHGRGAVEVFEHDSPAWRRVAELVGRSPSLTAAFGWQVALSTDGATALVGAPGERGGSGAAWVFRRVGRSWRREAELLACAGPGATRFGSAVALSSNGEVALVGAPDGDRSGVRPGRGAACLFTRHGSSWTPREKLAGPGGSDDAFGTAVALSGDGATAIVGATGADRLHGAAWVFVEHGSRWIDQGPPLLGLGLIGRAAFGSGVALSRDGDVALVAGSGDAEGIGAVWVFRRTRAAWRQDGLKLTGAGEIGPAGFGSSLGLSGNGGVALVGGSYDGDGFGAAWVFSRVGSTWNEDGLKLNGTGQSQLAGFGTSVAISADARTFLIGGPGGGRVRGAAWIISG